MCVDWIYNLLYIRAIQGHSGGELIDLELLNPVAIPPRCKEYLYHVGTFTVSSILQAGLIAGEKDTHKDDKRFFLLHILDPAGGETEEEYDDLTKPR